MTDSAHSHGPGTKSATIPKLDNDIVLIRGGNPDSTINLRTLDARLKKLEGVTPPVVPPVTPPASGATQITTAAWSDLKTLIANASVGNAIFTKSITVSGSAGDINIVRANAIIFTVAPGVTVTFDGGGSGELMLLGWDAGHAKNIYFRGLRADGTQGFMVQNFSVGQAGIVMTGYAESCGFSGATWRNNTGSGNGMTSHHIYVSTGVSNGGGTATGPGGAGLEFNDHDAIGDSGQLLSFLQQYHAPGPVGVTALRNKVSSVHWGAVLRNGSGFDIEGWTIDRAVTPFDGNGATGTVKNMKVTNSGGSTIGTMTDGGGNSW